MFFYEQLREAKWKSLSEQLNDNENKGQKQILLLDENHAKTLITMSSYSKRFKMI